MSNDLYTRKFMLHESVRNHSKTASFFKQFVKPASVKLNLPARNHFEGLPTKILCEFLYKLNRSSLRTRVVFNLILCYMPTRVCKETTSDTSKVMLVFKQNEEN